MTKVKGLNRQIDKKMDNQDRQQTDQWQMNRQTNQINAL